MSNNRNDSSNISDILNNNSEFIPPVSFIIDDEEVEEDYQEDLSVQNQGLKNTITYMMRNYPKDNICKKILGNKCAICLEEYKFNDKLVFTSCFHVFHKKCLNDCINNGTYNCPKCRFKFDNVGFMNIEMNLTITDIDFF